MERILIGIDGSEGGRAATRLGAEVAARAGAVAVLLHVMTPPAAPYTTSAPVVEEVFQQDDEVGRALLDEAGQVLEAAGVPFTEVVQHGAPAYVILEEADARGVDMIVLGHRADSLLERFLMGSVADRVSHKAHCAVLLAPPPEPEG